MRSLIELRDKCIDKAIEVCDSIDVTEDEMDLKARALVNVVNAACAASAQATADTWGPTRGKEKQEHG